MGAKMGRTNKLYSFIKYGNFSDDNINYLKQDTGKNNGQLIRDSFDRLISSAKSFNNTDYEIGLMKNNIELIKILCSKQKFDADEIEKRIRNRGDVDMIDRALFLKKKLEAMPENQGHIYNNTGKKTEDSIREIVLEQFLV